MRNFTLATLALLGAVAWTPPVTAQQPAPDAAAAAPTIRRIPLQRFDVPGTPYETVIGIADVSPNVWIGRHMHPGPESGYLLQGVLELLVEGEAPRLLKAGDSYKVPQGVTHDAKSGAEGARVIATYVVMKGQPLASPVK